MVFWPSSHPDFWPSSHLIIRPSDHLVIRPSGHLVIWSSRLLAIWSSDHLVIRSSDHTDFWSSGHLVFWPSILMPQKCPYWNIFDLPNCRLHQSQIPNVLPDTTTTYFWWWKRDPSFLVWKQHVNNMVMEWIFAAYLYTSLIIAEIIYDRQCPLCIL